MLYKASDALCDNGPMFIHVLCRSTTVIMLFTVVIWFFTMVIRLSLEQGLWWEGCYSLIMINITLYLSFGIWIAINLRET